MEYSTLTQIKTRLQNECDLFTGTDEGFVELDTELLGYINAAIDTAEAIIHGLYEDYFLCETTLTITSGTATVSAPSDIYGHKIRGLYYNNTSTSKLYPITRFLRFIDALTYAQDSNAPLRFLILNPSTGVSIKFYPTPTETGSLVSCFYIRNAKKLSSASDSCDIPEFIEFIYSHVKWSIARKERNQIDLETAKTEYMVQKELMEATLKDMVPDESSNLLVKDVSFYADFNDSSLDGVRGE